MEKDELTRALEHDAARRGRDTRSSRPVQEIRRLLLDAVLLVEKTDLVLKEGNAWTLRDDLLVAAHKLASAANALTAPSHPHLLNEDEDKR